MSNVAVIELPKDLAKVGLESDDDQERLLLLMANAWDTDWGTAFATNCDALEQRRKTGETAHSLTRYCG
jgi:hypothetical protein